MIRKRRVEPAAAPKPREELEALHGQVWDQQQLARDFVLTSIIGSTLIVRRRSDGQVGSLEYQNQPRFFFGFMRQPSSE